MLCDPLDGAHSSGDMGVVNVALRKSFVCCPGKPLCCLECDLLSPEQLWKEAACMHAIYHWVGTLASLIRAARSKFERAGEFGTAVIDRHPQEEGLERPVVRACSLPIDYFEDPCVDDHDFAYCRCVANDPPGVFYVGKDTNQSNEGCCNAERGVQEMLHPCAWDVDCQFLR